MRPTHRINQIFIEIAVVAFNWQWVRVRVVWVLSGPPDKWSFFNWMQWQLELQLLSIWLRMVVYLSPISQSPHFLLRFCFWTPNPADSECIFKWLLKALRKRLSLQWPRNWLSHAAAIKMSVGSVREFLAFDPFLFFGRMGVALQRVSG